MSRVSVAAVLLTGLVAGTAAAQHTTRQAVPGDNVAIFNLVGSLRVEGGSGSDVMVEVTTAGPDAEQLKIVTGAIGARQTLRVIYPQDDIVYGERDGRWGGGSTDVRVREDGTFDDHDGHHRGDYEDGDRIRIKGSGRGTEAWADLKVTVPAGKRVAVYLAVGKAVVSNVNGNITVKVFSASITAQQTRGTLTLDTGSGDIDLTDAQGDISLDTGSGSVTVSKVQGTRLHIDTGSGDVSATDATADAMDIDTGSGEVDLRGATSSDVNIDTGSGDVHVTLLSDVQSVHIETGSGAVTLTVPANLGATLDIDTGSGGIDLGFPVQVRRVESDHVTGTIGDGHGRITIETGSGGVRLLRS